MTTSTTLWEVSLGIFARSKTFFINSLSVFFIVTCFSASLYSQDCTGTVINIGSGEMGSWTVPQDEGPGPWLIEIVAKGAGGGDAGSNANGNSGGQGAEIRAQFIVENGEVILAIAGLAGGSGSLDAGGGGGGSGAVNCGAFPGDCPNGVILVVASGGNGGEAQGIGFGGSSANGPQGPGGTGGSGNGGGGGGGMLTAGGDGGGGDPGTGGSQVSPNGLVPGGFGSSDGGEGGEGMGGGGGGGSNNNNGSGGGAGRTGAPGGNSASATSYIHPDGTNVQGLDGSAGGGPTPGTVTVTCLGTLPIHLIDFKAVVLEKAVQLIWSTASEKDNLGFDIERSADNRQWSGLGFVRGNGTTAEKSEYTFTDESPLAGINYYRLKQTDIDGSFQYTPLVVADMRAASLVFDVFPNPSTDGALTFRTVSDREGEAHLDIWDWAGYKVWNENRHLWKGTTVWPVAMTHFPKGTYTVRLQMPDGSVQMKKVVLQ